MGWSDNGDGGKCFPYLELESTKNINVLHTFDFFVAIFKINITLEHINCYILVHIDN